MMSKMPILKGILACIVTLGLLAGGMYYYGWQNNTPLIHVISKPYWITVTVIITIAVTAFVYLNAKKDEQHKKEMDKRKRGNHQPE